MEGTSGGPSEQTIRWCKSRPTRARPAAAASWFAWAGGGFPPLLVLAGHIGVFLESGRRDKMNGPGPDPIGRFYKLARSGSSKKGVDRLKKFIADFDWSQQDLFNEGSERGSRSPTSSISHIRILKKGGRPTENFYLSFR